VIRKTGSPRIGSVLLLIGGVFQALVVALHVAMFLNISRAPVSDLPAAIKPLLHIFNAAVSYCRSLDVLEVEEILWRLVRPGDGHAA